MNRLSLAAALVVSLPFAAQAATVINATDGFNSSFSEVLSAGEVAEFQIVPDATLSFGISLSGSGTLASLESVTFGFTSAGGTEYFSIFPDPYKPGLFASIGFLPGPITSEPFSIFYVGGADIVDDPAVTLSINATAYEPPVTPVPVPAAGGMLLAGSALLAWLGRRKKA